MMCIVGRVGSDVRYSETGYRHLPRTADVSPPDQLLPNWAIVCPLFLYSTEQNVCSMLPPIPGRPFSRNQVPSEYSVVSQKLGPGSIVRVCVTWYDQLDQVDQLDQHFFHVLSTLIQ